MQISWGFGDVFRRRPGKVPPRLHSDKQISPAAAAR
jgi:hypothetical protein